MQDFSKYAVVMNISIKDLMDFGYKAEIKQAKDKAYKIVVFSKNNETLMATTAKNFQGEITQNTFIIFGKNANQEDRMYLTNSSNGMETIKIL